MGTYRGTILTKSPFFITESGPGGFTSNLEIRVWRGAIGLKPSAPTYTLAKQAVSSAETKVTFEISKLLSDFPETKGNLYDIPQSDSKTSWYVNLKSFGGTTNIDDDYFFINGYSDFLDGINYNIGGSKALIKTRKLYIPDENSDDIHIPVYIEHASFGGITNEIRSYTSDGTQTTTTINYETDDSLYVTKHISLPSQISGKDVVRLRFLESTSGDWHEDIEVKRVICNAHGHTEILFENSYGVLESTFFFGNNKKSSDIKKDKYKSQLVYNNGGSAYYDVTQHQYNSYNVTGLNKITINSGVVDEDYATVINEIINSPKIWLVIDDVLTPVTLDTKQIQYISDFDSKIVNYTLKFTYAFNNANMVY